MEYKDFVVQPFDSYEEARIKEMSDSERIWTLYIHIVPKEIRSTPDKEDYYDKYYVGITSKTTNSRWGIDGKRYKQQAFGKAIEKYGWDNIIHEVVAEHLTKDEACDLEKILVEKLMSFKGGHGYNRMIGGVLEGHDSKEDLTGKTFGRLTVLGNDPNDSDRVICQCSCEDKTIKSIDRYCLISGNTKSCGCYRKENSSTLTRTHNMSHTRLFQTWASIKYKCYHPNHALYKSNGALGIKMDEEWKNDFQSFYDWAMTTNYDEESRFYIDRIDKEKDWEPSNCQWLTRTEKANRRSITNMLTYHGKTQSLSDWARELNINRDTLYARLHSYNMSIEQAFETPYIPKNIQKSST